MRRALGYKLEREGKLLPQFVDYIEGRGERHLSTQAALGVGDAAGRQLRVVVGSAATCSRLRRSTCTRSIPQPKCRPPICCRARRVARRRISTTRRRSAALLAVTGTLRTPHRVATIRTLIGLLAVTGMRIGEAIALDREDFDARTRLPRDPWREVRQVPRTGAAPEHHGRRCAATCSRADRPAPSPDASPLLITMVGTRLLKSDAQRTFTTLTRRAGIEARSGSLPAPSCTICAIASRSRPCSTATTKIKMSAAGWRCWPPTSDTPIRPATYWYLSAAPELHAPRRRPAAAPPRRVAHDRPGPDPAGVLHRPPDQPAPRQRAHDRRLPRHLAPAPALRR